MSMSMPAGWGVYTAEVTRAGRWTWSVRYHHGPSVTTARLIIGEKRAERRARRGLERLRRDHARRETTRRIIQ